MILKIHLEEKILKLNAENKKLEARISGLKIVLKQILIDLPTNKDWLDPDLERIAKVLVKGE